MHFHWNECLVEFSDINSSSFSLTVLSINNEEENINIGCLSSSSQLQVTPMSKLNKIK